MKLELNSSWILTTEHPASRHFVPVLVDRASGATFDLNDTVMLPRNMGGSQRARVLVARLVKALPPAQQEQVKDLLV